MFVTSDPVIFSIPDTLHEVTEGESAEVCLQLTNHDLPRILFRLTVSYSSGNATGKIFCRCLCLHKNPVHREQRF